jgi:N-acetylmuramoyl-L-alanine amidase
MVTTGVLATAGDVTVQLTHHKAMARAGHRIGDHVYVNTDFLTAVGWTFSAQGSLLNVHGEGRSMRLAVHRIDGRAHVDIVEASRFVGGEPSWSADGTTLTVLSAVRGVEASPSSVRVDCSMGVSATAFKLSDPPRLVIDMFGAKVETERLGPLPAGHRIGQFAPGTVRYVVEGPDMASVQVPVFRPGRSIEVDLTRKATAAQGPAKAPAPPPIQITSAGLADDGTARGRLTVGFSGSAKQRPTARYAGPNTVVLTFPYAVSPDALAVQGSSRVVESVRVERQSADKVAFVVTTRRPMAFMVGQQGGEAYLRLYAPMFGGLAGRLVVVDAGHGGHDAGANHGGAKEKTNALDTARRLAAELEKAGASVIMTRDDDTFVDLHERPMVANRADADVFISCHFNSNTVANSRSGTIVFYHKEDPEGRLLAECIRSEVARASRLPDLGTWSDTRIYQSGFAVLRGAEMPGVLLELGFINHATDRARITDPAFRQAMAEAVVRALQVYFSNGE